MKDAPAPPPQTTSASLPDIDLPTPAASPRLMGLASWAHGGPRLPQGPLRVMEIGAGVGQNLLPLAFYDPTGHYLGLDDDAAKIEAARAAAAELNLANARFEVAGQEQPYLEGSFDVVMIRDLYARVPSSARARLLALAASVLGADGLLFIDYPVMPGAGHTALAGELLIPFASGGPEQAREKAKAFLGLLAKSDHPYPNLLARELARAAEAPLPELVGEYLRPAPRALFHREVDAEVRAFGLRFVGDAEHNRPSGVTPDALRAELSRLGLTGVDAEQAADIFCCRSARSSIFCKADHPGAEPLEPKDLDQLFIASPLTAVNEAPKLDAGAEEMFVTPLGQRMASGDTLFKACLMELQDRSPTPVSFADLMGGAVAVLRRSGAEGDPSDGQIASVAIDLFTLYQRGLVDLHLTMPASPSSPSRRLHALAKREAQTRTALTTPMHTLLPLQGLEAVLVHAMATQDDARAVEQSVVAAILSGAVPLQIGGFDVRDRKLIAPIAKGLIERAMATLASYGLLQS